MEGRDGVCVRLDSRVEAADLVGLLFGGDVLHFGMIERCDLIVRLWVVLCDDCLLSFLEETCVYIPHIQAFYLLRPSKFLCKWAA